MADEENTPAQISEENNTENLGGQATTALEPTQPQPSPSPSAEATAGQMEATAGNAEPTAQTENQNSEINSVPESPQEPIPDAPTPPIDSVPLEVPPEPPQASPSPESTILDSDAAEALPDKKDQNITVEKRGNDVTITEVMTPPPIRADWRELISLKIVFFLDF